MDQTGHSLSDPSVRITGLDCLRGFALCGIIFVNIGQVMNMTDVPFVVQTFVRYHFFPIFSALFGLGFGIFLQSAAAKTTAPRKTLLYRLIALAAIGLPHSLLQPGEVLLPYAAAGVVCLLPASYLPRWTLTALTAALLTAGLALGGEVYALIPGLLLAGYSLAAYDVHRLIPRAGLSRLLSALIIAAAAAAASYWLAARPYTAQAVSVLITDHNAGALLTSAAYVLGLLTLLATPARGLLEPVLAPLGRMALTNYVSATLIFVPAGHLLGLEGSSHWAIAVPLGAAILAVQAIWSPMWLSRFRYGPLEWAWRCATWQKPVPLRARCRDLGS